MINIGVYSLQYNLFCIVEKECVRTLALPLLLYSTFTWYLLPQTPIVPRCPDFFSFFYSCKPIWLHVRIQSKFRRSLSSACGNQQATAPSILSADVCSRPVKLREIKRHWKIKEVRFLRLHWGEAGKEALPASDYHGNRMGCKHRDHQMYNKLADLFLCHIPTLLL